MDVERAVYITLTSGAVISLSLFILGLILDIMGVKISIVVISAATAVLVMTPMARVVSALLAFISSKERYNALVALIVLFFMVLSLILGFLLRVMPS